MAETGETTETVERQSVLRDAPSWAPIEVPEGRVTGSSWKARLARVRRAERWLETRFVDVEGVKTRYAELGEGKDCLLLAAGFPETLQVWRYVAHDLAKRFKVYAVEPLGLGFTGRPYAADYSMFGLARHLRGFLDAVKVERAAVVGTDLGGGASLALALESPERVARLVVGGCQATVAGPYSWEIEGLRTPVVGELFLYFGGRFSILEALLRGYADPFAVTWPIYEEYLSPWHEFRACEVALEIFRAYAERLPDLEARLPEVRVPTLALWGEKDRFLSKRVGARVAEVVPGARFDVVPGAGHFAQEERPEAWVRRAAAFLEG